MFEANRSEADPSKCVRQDCQNAGFVALGGLCCVCKDADTKHFAKLEAKAAEVGAHVEQSRDNANKVKLHYFYSNARALKKMELSEVPDTGFGGVVASVVAYLDRQGDHYLAFATVQCLSAMANELGSADIAIEAFCDVCVYGERKYSRGNYRKGGTVCGYLDSALRHMRALMRGEKVDPESLCLHAAHAFWNLFTALDQPDFRDDRLEAVYVDE